ncbi:MAG TPA: glutamate--tRNA ligase [Gammaproteobacteria bacterium]|nr:glutamate--tRNA ligase [Gammaproteobacteria bacterium]
MSGETVKTRFAPSPTGDLHLGNARTALFNWLLARKLGGVFLLRIEDTDQTRSSGSSIQGIIDDLHWLGLEWDEGPGHGGPHAPYHQSERGAIYDEQFRRLAEAGAVYPCFCSAETLAIQRKTQLAAGRPPRYAGTCAKLTAAESQARRAKGEAHTWRFRVPAGVSVEFDDLVGGPQRFVTDDIGDFVIRRADGSAAFFFSNAVDDALMGITHVLRGNDHLSNTPRQLLLLQALKLHAPSYGHVNLIVGADGAPLSKRHGSASIEDLRAQGYLPAAVLNGLARLGHSYANTATMTPGELAAQFELKHLGAAPAHFDERQFEHWQREAILKAEEKTLIDWLDSDTRAFVPAECLKQFIHGVSGNILFPSDARDWASILYKDSIVMDNAATTLMQTVDKTIFRQALEILGSSGEDYLEFIRKLESVTPLRGKKLFAPLRAAFTGRLDGPALVALFNLMGTKRIRQRLEQVLC